MPGELTFILVVSVLADNRFSRSAVTRSHPQIAARAALRVLARPSW
jgi:hypothetical protein